MQSTEGAGQEGAVVRFERLAMVRAAVRASDSYGLLLILLLIDYLLLAFTDPGRWYGLVVGVPVSLTMLLALRTSHARPRGMRVAAVAVTIAIVFAVIDVAFLTDLNDAGFTLLLAVLLAAVPFAIVRRILSHSQVTVETILGAICVYIVIGIFFTVFFIGIAKLMPVIYGTPVPANHEFLAQPGPHPPENYLYLSFITLTTVGFGDLTPLSNVARSVVVLEALTGQIFLATLVARLVALYGLGRPAGFDARPPEDRGLTDARPPEDRGLTDARAAEGEEAGPGG